MSSYPPLLKALGQCDSYASDVVLATVVKIEGSAYRRPGARMLILADGHAVGTVSGGCLETEVCKKAVWLTRSGRAVLRRYSTGEQATFSAEWDHNLDEDVDEALDDALDEDQDGVRTFGLGCNGAVSVLFERVGWDTLKPVLDLLQTVHLSHQAGGIAVVIAAPTGEGLGIGDRLLQSPDSAQLAWCNTPVMDAGLEQQIRADLQATMHEQKSKHQVYMRAGGAVEVFFEYVAPPHRLVIFGAGLDAQPLVTLAKQQGWHVTVVDSRAHFDRSHLFPQADAVIFHAINQHERLAVDLQGAAVAVMTHSLTQDQYWLRYALAESPRYIGQLGPRHRTEKLLAAIESQMADPQGYAAGRAVLHYPIGLDLGGDSMEATALSILAEMTAVMNQRSAQMLSQKETSIHVS